MPEAVECRRTYQEQVHQVAVVEQQLVHDPILDPNGVGCSEFESTVLLEGDSYRWSLELPREARVIERVGVPPGKRQIEDSRHYHRTSDRCHSCPLTGPFIRRRSGRKSRIACRRAHYENAADCQSHGHRQQERSEPTRHGKALTSKRCYRHGQLGIATAPTYLEQD